MIPTRTMFLVMLLLLGPSLGFAPPGWAAECVVFSIILPGGIYRIVENYGMRIR